MHLCPDELAMLAPLIAGIRLCYCWLCQKLRNRGVHVDVKAD